MVTSVESQAEFLEEQWKGKMTVAFFLVSAVCNSSLFACFSFLALASMKKHHRRRDQLVVFLCLKDLEVLKNEFLYLVICLHSLVPLSG